MFQYCSPEGVLVPSPVTLVGTLGLGCAAVVGFLAVWVGVWEIAIIEANIRMAMAKDFVRISLSLWPSGLSKRQKQ